MSLVSNLDRTQGFAGRFHKFWESSYWPCKAACTKDKACEKTYYTERMWPCKAKALAAHDRAVLLPATGSAPALNVTPPYLLRAFYGARIKLIACLRSPRPASCAASAFTAAAPHACGCTLRHRLACDSSATRSQPRWRARASAPAPDRVGGSEVLKLR